MDQLFKTMDEAVEAARRWRSEKHGRDLAPRADPIHAMWGIGGGGPELEVRFLFPRFERPLEAVVRQVHIAKLTKIMQGARPGLFAQADDKDTRRLQACEYDLDRGMSIVSGTPLSEIIYKLPPEFRDLWRSWMCTSAREALGGYAAERARIAALLGPLIAP